MSTFKAWPHWSKIGILSVAIDLFAYGLDEIIFYSQLHLFNGCTSEHCFPYPLFLPQVVRPVLGYYGINLWLAVPVIFVIGALLSPVIRLIGRRLSRFESPSMRGVFWGLFVTIMSYVGIALRVLPGQWYAWHWLNISDWDVVLFNLVVGAGIGLVMGHSIHNLAGKKS